MPDEIDVTIDGYPVCCLCCRRQVADYVVIETDLSNEGKVEICLNCMDNISDAIKEARHA